MIINKEKLLELLVDKSGLPREEVKDQLDELVQNIREAAEKGNDFEIDVFGTFSVNKDGSLTFTPSEKLETEINHRYAGMKPIEMIGAFKEAPGVDVEDPDDFSDDDAEEISSSFVYDSEPEPEEEVLMDTGAEEDDEMDSADTVQREEGDEDEQQQEDKKAPFDLSNFGKRREQASEHERDASAESKTEAKEQDKPDDEPSEDPFDIEKHAEADSGAGNEQDLDENEDEPEEEKAGPVPPGKEPFREQQLKKKEPAKGKDDEPEKPASRKADRPDAAAMTPLKVSSASRQQGQKPQHKKQEQKQKQQHRKEATGKSKKKKTSARARKSDGDPIGQFLIAAVVVIAIGVAGWLTYDLLLAGSGSSPSQSTNTGTSTTAQADLSGSGNAGTGTITEGAQEGQPESGGEDTEPVTTGGQETATTQETEGGEGNQASEQESSQAIESNESVSDIADQSRQSIYRLRGGAVPRAEEGYTIVVHSLRNEAKARSLAQQMETDGYITVVTSAVVNGMQYWRVGLGQFRSMEDAEEAVQQLPERYRNNHFIRSFQ